jgi:hypothetical protein
MTDEYKTERLQLMMSPSELAAIDDWRYSHHIPSRAEAVRLLIQRSLDAENATKKQAKDPGK